MVGLNLAFVEVRKWEEGASEPEAVALSYLSARPDRAISTRKAHTAIKLPFAPVRLSPPGQPPPEE
jgi:hypothetical protein